jgi:transposase
METMTRDRESSAPRVCVLLAFELGQRTWKLGFTVGVGQRPRVREIPARAVSVLVQEIVQAKKKLRVASDTPVVSCYEAGRDGFWLHRYLVAQGITN